MRQSQSGVDAPLSVLLQDLCDEYGVWRTGRALIAAAWARHRCRNDIANLSNRMRRDIGFPELPDEREPGKVNFWDLRL